MHGLKKGIARLCKLSRNLSIKLKMTPDTQLMTEIKSMFQEFKTELKTEIAELKTELKTEIAELNTELKADMSVKSSIRVVSFVSISSIRVVRSVPISSILVISSPSLTFISSLVIAEFAESKDAAICPTSETESALPPAVAEATLPRSSLLLMAPW
eukprot:gene5667-1648_t